MNNPESPRPLSEAADAYLSWLLQRLTQTADEWRPVDGTLVSTLAELLETQENLATELSAQPVNPMLIRLRLQVAAQIATYSRMLGLCPKHRQVRQQNATDPERLQRIAMELGLPSQVVRQLGNAEPDADKLNRIAENLGISPELLAGSPQG